MGTWRVADIEKVVAVIQALNGIEWPQTGGVIQDFLESLGWTPIAEGLAMLSKLGVTPGGVVLTTVRDELTQVEFAVCDVFPDDEFEVKTDFLQDAFADYAIGLRKLWGRPILTRSIPLPEIWWSIDNRCVLKLERNEISLTVEFVTPLGVSIDKIPDVRL